MYDQMLNAAYQANQYVSFSLLQSKTLRRLFLQTADGLKNQLFYSWLTQHFSKPGSAQAYNQRQFQCVYRLLFTQQTLSNLPPLLIALLLLPVLKKIQFMLTCKYERIHLDRKFKMKLLCCLFRNIIVFFKFSFQSQSVRI